MITHRSNGNITAWEKLSQIHEGGGKNAHSLSVWKLMNTKEGGAAAARGDDGRDDLTILARRFFLLTFA